MAEPFTVDISELRVATARALDAVEASLGSTVTLSGDHYWHLPVEDAFDLTSEPDTLTVGQVTDDLESLRDRRVVEPNEARHELAHLIGVLRAIEAATRP